MSPNRQAERRMIKAIDKLTTKWRELVDSPGILWTCSEFRHIGPVAEDFSAAFEVGEGDKHIATVDADGARLWRQSRV